MTQDINHILSSQYPSIVKDAVRYGYQYRKESEVFCANAHFSLPAPSQALLWFASAIASGIAYDVIKETAKRLLSYLKEHKQKVDKETERVLSDEDALREFTIYMEEYYAHDMKISVEQEKYIKEEVVADATGEEASRIYQETGRITFSKEEYITIERKAIKKAEDLIHRHKQ